MMLDQLLALILDEGKWFPISMGLAFLSVTVLLLRHRHADLRRRILLAMNLFFGVTIGTMAFGHLLAVTIKTASGTLQASLPVPALYAIGIVLAVPSWWLAYHARGLIAPSPDGDRRTVMLNVWLALTLVALGVPNLPLAVPASFNIAYQLHSGRAVGWAIVSVAVVLNVGLFIASLVFAMSGQTFEQFSGE
jgi:hypothetical protein